MEFSVKSGSPEKQRTACIVAGVFEPRRLSQVAEQLDQISGGFISNILRRGDLEGKAGQMLLLHNVPNTLCDRVLLVGCGKERDLDDAQYREIITKTIAQLNETGSMEAVSFLTDLNVKGRDIHWKVRTAVEAAENSLYRFDQLKSKKADIRRPLRKMVMTVPTRAELKIGEQAIIEGQAISQGMTLTRDLANMPGNICTPQYLADQATELATTYDSIKTEVISEPELEKMGMGAFVSVSRASKEEGKLIAMEHMQGPEGQKPIVLVGKGITFDSGGISLKPGAGMDEMKYDMGGAASVFGTMKAIAEMNLPINVVGVIAAAENMPGGDASKPGDIVTSLAGITIEVLNTDAEGRLVLCDTLTWVEKYQPEAVIDIATLTGACIMALGHVASAVLANHNPLAHDLLNAGEYTGDRAWRLPLWDEYHEQLKSNFADLANIGGRPAGTITAGCFLSNFTKKYNWAHLDIAGTAWKSGAQKGATGRPVQMLTQYVMNRAQVKQD
ncbi:leucyl aminopeptidase [Pelagibaculum spongiae]|uniref:Probable cytosol aminopeptidase n=1 Tax=Pelagibaculum spongiae TaxID=2080658 RepID=A0A2V1GPX2_9GAMM|nr:leucyl aminopeptidase [Pelagibaculum spongiae]PVZ65453.1 leucyl aminopeptidase [Pelagibaculum spongiae]